MKIYFRIFREIRKYLLAGLGILFPLFISLYIIYLMFSFSNRFAGRFINAYLKDTYGVMIPGLGFFLIIVILVITGFVTTRLIGRKLFSLLEIIIIKVPLLSNLYPPAKQLSDYLFKEHKNEAFKKVVLVEFPYKGTYSIGFITNEDLALLDAAAQTKLINVFIPLAPSPFSGLLLLVPRDKIKVLDISFGTAIKYVVSGGIVFQPQKR